MAAGANRYSICQNSLRSGDLATDVAWAAAAGAAAISLDAGIVRAFGAAKAAAVVREAGLQVSTIVGGPTFTKPLDPRARQLSAELFGEVSEVVDACTSLGASGILVTTGPRGQLSQSDADRLSRTWFEHMAPLAAASGVRFLLEAVHPMLESVSHVHTLRHGAEIVSGIAATGLLADTGHLWWDRHLESDLQELMPMIGSVQIDDVNIQTDLSDNAGVRHYRYLRAQLGAGLVPLRDLLGCVESAGYTGWYENENIVAVPAEDRVEFFVEGRRVLESLLRSLELSGHVK